MKRIDKNIVFIGLSGCGKTTIGKILAKKLNMKYCDIDEYIEEREGKSIPEIFKNGEDHFREIESRAVKEVSQNSSMVISTGGGVIKLPENMEQLRKKGIIIFINRPVEDIVSDIDISNRPLLKDGKEAVYKLYRERYFLYKKYCDYEVLNKKSLPMTVDKIIKYLTINYSFKNSDDFDAAIKAGIGSKM